MEKPLNFHSLINSPFRDHFGRRYPYTISLVNGDRFVGIYAGDTSNDDGFESFRFKIIEDLNEWITNKDHIGTRIINLDAEEIKEMIVYREYPKTTKD